MFHLLIRLLELLPFECNINGLHDVIGRILGHRPLAPELKHWPGVCLNGISFHYLERHSVILAYTSGHKTTCTF